MYKRAEYKLITECLKEPRRFIQTIMGARQIGKSTVVKQMLPISHNTRSSYEETDFVGLYHFIQIDKNQNTDKNNIWVHNGDDYVKH